MKKKEIKVLFYAQDNFTNPHFFRKSYIGSMRESEYEEAKETNIIVFKLGDNYLQDANDMPETITL